MTDIFLSSTPSAGAFSSLNTVYSIAKKRDKTVTRAICKSFLEMIESYALFKRVRRRFTRRQFVSLYPFDVFSCDLIFFMKPKDTKVVTRQRTVCLMVQDTFR